MSGLWSRAQIQGHIRAISWSTDIFLTGLEPTALDIIHVLLALPHP